MNNINMAFFITIFAGLSTLLGIIPCFLNIKYENNLLCASLSFAASIMLGVSIFDLLPESFIFLIEFNDFIRLTIIFIFVIIGIIISFFINASVIKYENCSLYRLGIISMLAIIIHNIPEGIITFISVSKDLNLGISLAIVIIVHNIPEGISISIPIYYATGSIIRAFLYTFISGLSELFGALITYLFLSSFITNSILGILLAITSGIMINISLSELLPSSLLYNNRKLTFFFFFIGFFIIIVNFII